MKKEKQTIKEVLEIKRKIEEAGLENLLDKLVYMPETPVLGIENIEKEFILGEIAGVKVAFMVDVKDE